MLLTPALRLAGLCLSGLLLWGCTSTAPVKTGDGASIQWPPWPQAARIAWVKDIRGFEDVGITKGFWQKFSDFIFGASPQYIGKPYGVFSDAAHRLFIVDTGRAMVHVMDPEKGSYWAIGDRKNGESAFVTPIAVTADDVGNLYITDSGKGVVFRYRFSERQLEPFISGLRRPTGIAFDREKGLVYVSDTLSHQVLAYTLEGTLRQSIGERGDGPGSFNFPTDLFVANGGKLFVTDALNSRVQMFRENGTFLGTFGSAGDSSGYLAKPKGVAVDSDGNIYVVDALLDAVQIFNPKGELLLDFGDHGTGPGQFWLPSGIYLDKDDTIFVADSYNHRIQVFRYLRPQASGPALPGGTGDGTHPR